MKKILALLLALVLVFALVACGNGGNDENKDMGTIMWLSNLTSGAQYDATVAYLEALCEALGYDFTVVYGSMLNDAAENLLAVQNAMTSDVVGLITSQDGGLAPIMEEYPELWVAGYNTDMRSVYGEGGENAACLQNDHFLGTICDGYGSGFPTGKDYANACIEAGYKKVAIVNFPFFAYPSLTEADQSFRETIATHNAANPDAAVEIVGETTTLMFAPLEDSWFLEEGRKDLDAIIGLCAGVQFIYPVMVTAIANGNCNPDIKLITSGFETDADIIADIGENGLIGSLQVSPAEDPAYALILIDNAVTGHQYSDFSNLCVDSAPYVINSAEDINNVMTKSLMGTGKVEDAHLTVDEIVALCGRNNSDMTHAELISIFQSISVDDLK